MTCNFLLLCCFHLAFLLLYILEVWEKPVLILEMFHRIYQWSPFLCWEVFKLLTESLLQVCSDFLPFLESLLVIFHLGHLICWGITANSIPYTSFTSVRWVVMSFSFQIFVICVFSFFFVNSKPCQFYWSFQNTNFYFIDFFLSFFLLHSISALMFIISVLLLGWDYFALLFVVP